MPNVINGSFDSREELQGTLHQEIPILNAQISVPSTGVIVGDYKILGNHPSIEGVELIDNKTFEDFGLVPVTDAEIDETCVIPVASESEEEEEPNE